MSYIIKIKGSYKGGVYVKDSYITSKEVVDKGITLSCPVRASTYITLEMAEYVCSIINSATNVEVEPIELRYAFDYYHQETSSNIP